MNTMDRGEIPRPFPNSTTTTTAPTKTAIAMTLPEYEALVEEYCKEKAGDSTDALRRLFLSNFIAWARNRMKENDREFTKRS